MPAPTMGRVLEARAFSVRRVPRERAARSVSSLEARRRTADLADSSAARTPSFRSAWLTAPGKTLRRMSWRKAAGSLRESGSSRAAIVPASLPFQAEHGDGVGDGRGEHGEGAGEGAGGGADRQGPLAGVLHGAFGDLLGGDVGVLRRSSWAARRQSSGSGMTKVRSFSRSTWVPPG